MYWYLENDHLVRTPAHRGFGKGWRFCTSFVVFSAAGTDSRFEAEIRYSLPASNFKERSRIVGANGSPLEQRNTGSLLDRLSARQVVYGDLCRWNASVPGWTPLSRTAMESGDCRSPTPFHSVKARS